MEAAYDAPVRLLLVPTLLLALVSPAAARAADAPPDSPVTPKSSELPPDDEAATPGGAGGSWDRRFFDLPVKERDKEAIDPLLAERLTSPEVERRAEQTRHAASAIGTGATLIGIAGLVALGGAMSNSKSDTPYWIAGIGGGIGVSVLGAGLITLATRPVVPASVER